jgi:hypothetical protein
MTIYKTRLEARVAAANLANNYAAELYPKLAEALAPFVGLKVETVDGALLAKVKARLPEMPSTPQLRVYRRAGSHYSLAWTVNTCTSSKGQGCDYANYEEVTVYVGELSGGILTKLSPAFKPSAPYTVESVLSAREAYRVAKAAADKAHSALHPFGEYDR